MTRVKTLYAHHYNRVSGKPSFHGSGSSVGMRQKYYGENALLVRCGKYIFNVSDEPDIYHELAH